MTEHESTTTSTSGLTFEEMSESLTGFDEIAVEKHMGLDVYTDAERKPVGLIRALVFVHKRRPEGGSLSDSDARKAALGMRVRDLNDYFEDDTEVDEDHPQTPAGNDDALPA